MPMLIITGANRGLGLELARQYIGDAWDVIAINRNSSPALDPLAKSNNLRVLEADLTDDLSLRAAVARIGDAAVDLLINNAGTMGNLSFADAGLHCQAFGSFDRDEWRRVFDINVYTPMALTELLVDNLATAKNPCVVTLSSMLGSNAMNTVGNIYAYRASKAAVNSIMKSMGVNLRRRRIIAVAIQPGWVKTDMGGPDADLEIGESITAVRSTIGGLTLADSGKLLSHDGSEMPY